MKLSIRNVFSWLLACILILIGSVRRAKMNAFKGEFILSLYFHNPSKIEFERCIKWLKKNAFVFLSIYDVLEIIQKDLPLPKGAVLLTADDGWQLNNDSIVEVANRYNVPVTIFVSTEPVEEGAYWWSYLKGAKQFIPEIPSKRSLKKVDNAKRLEIINTLKKQRILEREALTIEQVKSIARSGSITIGGHTHSHPILINCDDAQVYSELSVSKQKLESWIEGEVSSFAYPNGDYRDREIQLLKKLNYKIAFTNKPQYLTKEKSRQSYELPRFGYLEGASFAENICRVVGVWQPLMLKFQRFYKSNNKNKAVPSTTIANEALETMPQLN
jgi:poly-beta-1,6-N-acetyl-D-glucosamine N-deacetylase